LFGLFCQPIQFNGLLADLGVELGALALEFLGVGLASLSMKTRTSFRNLIALTGSAIITASTAHAAILYWDGAVDLGAPGGGTGTWDTITNNWDSAPTGHTPSAWSNSPGDFAVFGGTFGTVTLGTGITVGGMRFDTTGYTITGGGNTLSFAAGTNSILFNNIAAATITGAVGGSGNVVLSSTNPTTGVLTLNGTSAGGWSGTTTINAGMTMALAVSNQALLNTSGITLNGGGLRLTNTVDGEKALDRVSDTAGIVVNGGGTVTYTNTAASAREYTETLGAVTVNNGQFNAVLATNQNGAGSPTNKQTLTLGSAGSNVSGSGLARTSATSAVTFSSASALNATTNRIAVYGSSNTTAGQIVGPWATTGTAATAQTDYAIVSGGYVQAAGNTLAVTGESGWGSDTTAYQFATAQTLTDNRNAAALRYTAGANALGLGGFTLATNGILNGGTGTLTISGTGALTATGSTGGNLFLTTGNRAITVSSAINDNGGAVTLVKGGAGSTATNGTLTLSSTTSNFSGGIVLNAGQLTTTSNANLGALTNTITVNGTASWDGGGATYARDLTINEGAVFSMLGASQFTISGVLSGNGTLRNDGAYNQYNFTNTNNTFTGIVFSKYLTQFASLADSSNTINITGSNSQFVWIGGTKTFALRPFTLNDIASPNSGQIYSSGTGALTVQQDLAISGPAGARMFVLGGTNTAANTFSGRIADGTSGGASVVSLTKAAAGNWNLTAANTYTGATSVNAGLLNVTGSLTSNVTVASGATLAGTGSTTGTLALSNGSTIMGGATGSSFKAETVTATTAVKIAGSDGSGTLGSHTIGVVRYNSGTGPTIANFSTVGYHAGATLSNVGTSGGETQLTYTNEARTWNSALATWDAMTTTSWSGGDSKFGHGDAVTFNDAGTGGGGARTVNVTGTITPGVVTPGSVTFANTTSTYTVGGVGSIAGTSGLTKSGSGMVTISNHNLYTGATTVSGGILAVNGSLANTTTTIQSGGKLQGSGAIAGAVTVQNGGTIAAGNSIESLGAGSLTLDAGSIFDQEINNAALAGVAADLTFVTGNLSITSGATLTLADLGVGTWDLGEKLTLISYGGTWNGGLFTYGANTITDDEVFSFSGSNWVFNYNDTVEGTNYAGDSFGTYVTMTVIPEPNVAALLGGLGLLMIFRRRR